MDRLLSFVAIGLALVLAAGTPVVVSLRCAHQRDQSAIRRRVCVLYGIALESAALSIMALGLLGVGAFGGAWHALALIGALSAVGALSAIIAATVVGKDSRV